MEEDSVERLLAQAVAGLAAAGLSALLIPVAWLWGLFTWSEHLDTVLLFAEAPVSLAILAVVIVPMQAVTRRRGLQIGLGIGLYLAVGLLYGAVASLVMTGPRPPWQIIVLWPGEALSLIVASLLLG